MMTAFGTELGTSGVDESLSISALEFDVLWEHLQLEDMPVVLRVPSPGGTYAERTRLVRAAWDSLGAKGYGRPVDLDPRLARMLRVLERPDREVDGRLWVDRQIRLLAAIRNDFAVLAVLADNKLTLRPAAATGLPREALTALPAVAAGPGESVTLPSAQFERAAAQASTSKQFEQALKQHGARDADARNLVKMITDVSGQGQFGAAARDKWGSRIRVGHVISFFDTEEGRYVQIRKETKAGEAWSTISPVDSRRMHQHLKAVFDEVVATADRR